MRNVSDLKYLQYAHKSANTPRLESVDVVGYSVVRYSGRMLAGVAVGGAQNVGVKDGCGITMGSNHYWSQNYQGT